MRARASTVLPHLSRTKELRTGLEAYFYRTSPVFGICIIILSVPLLIPVLLLVSLTSRNTGVADLLGGCLTCGFPGILVFLAGLAAIVLPQIYKQKQAADEEVDQVLAHDCDQLTGFGLRKLQMHGDGSGTHDFSILGPPRVIRMGVTRSPLDERWSSFPDALVGWVTGRDGRLRFRIQRFTALYLAQHHLGYYSCTFNIESGFIIEENVSEANYKDIVAIETEIRCFRDQYLPGWWMRIRETASILQIGKFFFEIAGAILGRFLKYTDSSISAFTIHLAGGQSLDVPYLAAISEDSGRSLDSMSDEIAQLRFLLREKRSSIVRVATA